MSTGIKMFVRMRKNRRKKPKHVLTIALPISSGMPVETVKAFVPA